MAAPGVVLNLGSHWKAIEIDPQGQVAGSITTLSGEMVHAVQTTTILASAVPTDRPNSLDPHWVSAGMREQRRRGLPRALFCVRLLEQAASTSPAERLAFLIGAFIACDMGALLSAGKIAKHINMAIVGNAAIAQAWRFALGEEGIAAICIGEQQTETALLAGLQSILAMKNV
jgi:2-dehydro-3-deoxygalactonokinase